MARQIVDSWALSRALTSSPVIDEVVEDVKTLLRTRGARWHVPMVCQLAPEGPRALVVVIVSTQRLLAVDSHCCCCCWCCFFPTLSSTAPWCQKVGGGDFALLGFLDGSHQFVARMKVFTLTPKCSSLLSNMKRKSFYPRGCGQGQRRSLKSTGTLVGTYIKWANSLTFKHKC